MSILTQVKKERKKENPITLINERIDREIKQIYSRLHGNVENSKTLTEERHEYVIKLAALYNEKRKLGVIPIKKYQILRYLYKEMKREMGIPIYSYVVLTTIVPKSFKRPYHWRKIDNKHAEVTELDDQKGAITKTIEEVDTSEYSPDGTHKEVSEIIFSPINEALKKIDKHDLDSLSPDMVKEIFDCLKSKSEIVKKYCKLYNIKVDDSDDRESSIALTYKKPRNYRDNMLDNELHLAEKDLSVMRKKLKSLELTEEEKYIYWEAVRALRLWFRPQVNDKYRRDWNGYAKIIDILDRKGISGVAKETKSTVKVYDQKTQEFVHLYEIVKNNQDKKDGDEDKMDKKQLVKLKRRMKGITRNHLRNMIPKCNKFYMDFITDFPFLEEFSALFAKYLQPIRDGKALLVSDKH